MRILYKKTASGATQQWAQEISGASYRTISGQVGGKMVISDWHVCNPKNVGKANETSAEEQCLKEVAANYTKKEKSYAISLEDIVDFKFFKPMLAKHFKDYQKKITYPVFVQPKFDGIRCVISKDGAFSRTGEPITTVPHIVNSLASVFVEYPDLILDGELYNHELKDDFNRICSLVKREKPTEEDLWNSENYILYYLYDCNLPVVFSERSNFLQDLFERNHVVLSSTWIAKSKEEVDEHLQTCLVAGYEGAMVRLNGFYETKRSNNLLKYKVNDTEEFELLDILEGQGNWAALAKKALLRTTTGIEFEASVAATRELCKTYLENKDAYIGKPTTVKFNGYTPGGKPRFGVIKEFDRKY